MTTLTACTGAQNGGARYVESPAEWKAIDLAEADLNLPLVAPLEIASLERRVGDGSEREEIYTFHNVPGYVKTTRMAKGIYPETYAKSLKSGRPRSDTYMAGLSLPPASRIYAPWWPAFLNGKFRSGRSLSRGFTADASAPPYYENCFVARTAYLFVDLAAIERTEDAVDTVVEVLLCGDDLRPYNEMVQMLMRVDVVQDRAAFRRALSRNPIGTI
ncbi:MAG: hypothetical protein RLN99_01610 [Kiloniellaceae bacterium]